MTGQGRQGSIIQSWSKGAGRLRVRDRQSGQAGGYMVRTGKGEKSGG
jgi:hypothetical protein